MFSVCALHLFWKEYYIVLGLILRTFMILSTCFLCMRKLTPRVLIFSHTSNRRSLPNLKGASPYLFHELHLFQERYIHLSSDKPCALKMNACRLPCFKAPYIRVIILTGELWINENSPSCLFSLHLGVLCWLNTGWYRVFSNIWNEKMDFDRRFKMA